MCIDLSNKQIKILKVIKKYKRFDIISSKLGYTLDEYLDLQENFPNSFDYLIFSDNNFDSNTTVELTQYAYSIIEKHDRENFRFWFPIIISTLALIVSVIRIFY